MAPISIKSQETPDPELRRLMEAVTVVHAAQCGDRTSATRDLDQAIDCLVDWIVASYSRNCDTYTAVRGTRTTSWEESLTRILLAAVRQQIASGHISAPREGRWRLLDVGGGSGRDMLRFAAEPDIDVAVLDGAPALVRHLRELAEAHHLATDSVIEADMRDLSALGPETFQCVRIHAALHHLPLVGAGRGADLAIAESRRVLVAGGVLYVVARAGEDLLVIDTDEGLGPRVFQLFSPRSLSELLERQGFRVMRMESIKSWRGRDAIDWVFSLATVAP